jgi:hypothetical protein
MEPGTLPWGIPLVTVVHYKPVPFIKTFCFLFARKSRFRKGKSCATQLIEVLDNWIEQLDNRSAIDMIYLDFQKAFDTVPHQRLINKLQSYGICGNILWSLSCIQLMLN